jgi:hypothetical protein
VSPKTCERHGRSQVQHRINRAADEVRRDAPKDAVGFVDRDHLKRALIGDEIEDCAPPGQS